MQQRRFGPRNKLVSVVGQGTWNLEDADRVTAITALRRGLDLGMTHIDTAEMYASGRVEEIVGRGDRRASVTRCSWSPRCCPRTPPGGDDRGLRACRSRALRTDRLDCYLLHWRGGYPLEETIAAFEQLQRPGKILSWGVSNFDVADLEEAWRIAGPGRIVCNQVLYHLQERAIEHAVLPWCEAPTWRWWATVPSATAAFPVRARRAVSVCRRSPRRTRPRRARWRCASWCGGRRLFTIPKASTPEHAADNAGAGDLQLSQAELGGSTARFRQGGPVRFRRCETTRFPASGFRLPASGFRGS